MKHIIFPPLGVPDDTFPLTGFGTGEYRVIFYRENRFQTENFNPGTTLTLEKKPRRNNLGIVEYHKAVGGEMFGEIPEDIFAYHSISVYQQFGSVTLFQRIFCNPGFRQVIPIIFDFNVRYHIMQKYLKNSKCKTRE